MAKVDAFGVGACVGVAFGAIGMGGFLHYLNIPLPTSVANASGDFYQVATDQNLVTEEELFEACVEAVNEKTETAVKAWVNSKPGPADSPSPNP